MSRSSADFGSFLTYQFTGGIFMKKVTESAFCRTFATFSVIFSVGLFAGSSYGASKPTHPELRAGFSAYRQNRTDLANGYIHRVAKRSLDILIARGCDELRQIGEFNLASQLQNEWTLQVAP